MMVMLGTGIDRHALAESMHGGAADGEGLFKNGFCDENNGPQTHAYDALRQNMLVYLSQSLSLFTSLATALMPDPASRVYYAPVHVTKYSSVFALETRLPCRLDLRYPRYLHAQHHN